MTPMRILFAGTPEVAVPSLRALLEDERFEVAAVLTRPDARQGRGRSLKRSPVGAVAGAAGIPVLTPTTLKTPEIQATINELAPAAIAVVAYGLIVPPALLDVPAHGWINLHFSLLPAYRGAAPVQAAIAAGETTTGITTFRIAAGLDTGELYEQVPVDIDPRETAGELLDRLAADGAAVLADTLLGLAAGTTTGTPQDEARASHVGKIAVEDAHLDFTQPAAIVSALSRGVTPAPGAWAHLGEQRLKLGPVFPAAPHPQLPETLEPALIAVTKKQVYVGTADQPVELTTVQAPGKKPMRAVDWARGARLEEKATLS